MTFDELRVEAEQLGFTFDLQEWESDDYTLDDDEKEHWFKTQEKQLKVTFPPDWPRPAVRINLGDVKALEAAIKEYKNKDEIRARNIEYSRNTIEALKKLFPKS